jgi:hypothetical protein
MTRKYKLVILLAVAALAMTALTFVNWQAAQDRGPRRPAVSAPGVTPDAGSRVGMSGRDRWTVS